MIEALKYVQRFPRLVRFPRLRSRKERSKLGTLLCICGEPGRHFVQAVEYNRAFCSRECEDLFRVHKGLQTYHWMSTKMSKEPGWQDFIKGG